MLAVLAWIDVNRSKSSGTGTSPGHPKVITMSRTTIRQWHGYVGLFIAPSVLFFALTGALQVFSLHEAHGNYRPLALVEKLSSVHKDQVFSLGHHHDSAPPEAAKNPDPGAPSPPAAEEDDDEPTLSTALLKWFFLLVAICLAFSTAFGIWMGLTQTRRKRLAWLLLTAGALIPLVLLVI